MTRNMLATLLAVLLIALAPAGSAQAMPSYDRVYLLSNDGDYLYWSVDRFDPELGLASTSRPCGLRYFVPGRAKPCLIGVDAASGAQTYNLFFLPASSLDENLTWSTAAPLKFHIEAEVNTGGVPYTLQLVLQKPTALVLSDPATQVSPGVFEGQITAGGPVNTTDLTPIAIRVTSQAPVALIDMQLGGRSYVELPRPFAAHGVPDMIREDVYGPQPTTYSSATRSFSFNDANWAVRTFSGDTTAARTFDISTGQKAKALIAWAELYDSTFIQDAKHLRPLDSRKALQGLRLALSRDGQAITNSGLAGNANTGTTGRGTPSVGTVDLPAGPLSLAVEPAQPGDQSLPYTVHVLEIRGDRTLRTMRWLFMQDRSSRSPAAALCPGVNEFVPATDKVKSIGLDLDWDTEAVGNPGWTWRFAMPYGEYPCSEAGTGDEIRLTLPPADRMWRIGATPSYGSTFYSQYDTTFQATARYTYSVPPAA